MTDDNRQLQVVIPRDRNSTFEPVDIPKHERRLSLFNDQIISMYAFGIICRDIKAHLEKVYGVEVSAELVSRVTESVMEWQNRPVEKAYPILYLDALRINCRQDGKTINKALYVALAITFEGKKESFGLMAC